MATTTHYVAKVGFKTGRLQRELLELLTPKDNLTAHVGDVFKVDSNGELERIESTTSAADAKSKVLKDQYILAQSDMTLDKGHVPVENRDYRYNDTVVMKDSTPRRLAVYKIINIDDVAVDTYTYTTTT